MKQNRPLVTAWILKAAIAAVIIVPVARAQVQIDDGPLPQVAIQPAQPNDPAAGKDLQAVYVRDSGVATEKLALAERMERLKEWGKSADVYQEVVEKYSDRVIPSKSDDKQYIIQYSSVALVVQEKLAHWPKEGLDFYRSRYEDVARDQLAKAGNDPRLLGQVFGLYFVTDAGRDAGLKLCRDNFERGEFAGAAWAGHRLLSLHPNLTDERARLLFLTGLADRLSGNASSAQNNLHELQSQFPKVLATIGGKEIALADALARDLEAPTSLSRTYRSDSWPMAFGTPDRSAVPSGVVTSGARLFSIELPSLLPRNLNRMQLKTLKAQMEADRKKGLNTGIMPVIDRGELFFTDNVNVFAYGLQSGQPLSGWAKTYPGTGKGYFSSEGWPMAKQVQSCVTVDDRAVYAILGQTSSLFSMVYLGGTQTSSQIVCLDRTNGRRLWGAQASQMKLSGDAQPVANPGMPGMQNALFYGSPMLVGDTVYALLRAWKGGQFEEVNVVALSAQTGEMKWCSYVASSAAGNGAMNFGMDDESPGGNCLPAHLAYADGRLYVQTNLGALGCMDAADGKVFWLNIYAQPPASAARNARMRGNVFINRANIGQSDNGQRAYSFNPVIVTDGRVITLPTDSPFIYVYDASSGEIIKQLPRVFKTSSRGGSKSDEEINVETLLGVANGELFAASRKALIALPLATYDPTKSLDANNVRYVFAEGADDEFLGRPLLTDTHILYTDSQKLKAMNIKKWRLESTYPSQGAWSPDEQPGNLVATPEHLVIAGATRVTVYTDLTLARKRIDSSIAEAPADPAPHLRAAEILFAAGITEEAITHLDTAIAQLGGRSSLTPGPMRDRLFDCVITNAIKFSRAQDKARDLADPMFDRAKDVAYSPTQQTIYRMRRAAALHEAKDFSGELVVLHDVLSKPEWRKSPAVLDAALPNAGAEAEQLVGRLIATQSRDLYTPFEDASAAALATATEKSDLDGLLAVADRYPNSRASSMALLSASEIMEEAGASRLASMTFRRALKRATSDEARTRILEGLARASAQSGTGLDLAIARLQQAAKIAPTRQLSRPIVVSKDRKIEGVTLKEAAGMLTQIRASRYEEDLPTLNLPTSWETTFVAGGEMQKVSSIVKADRGLSRPDRLVVWTTDKQISVVEPGNAKPLVSGIAFPDAPFGCAWSGDQVIVCGLKRIVCIDTKAGTMAWEKTLEVIPSVATANESPANESPDRDPAAGDERNGQVVRRVGNRLVIQQAGGNIRVVNLNGQVNIDGPDGAPARSGDEVFAHCQVLSDRVIATTSNGRIVSFDLDKGDLSWQIRPDDNGYSHFKAIDDFVVVASQDQNGTSEMITIDASSGQVIRRKSFDPSMQPNAQLTNLALSNDGWLVVATTDHLVGFNLFDSSNGERPSYDKPIPRGAGMGDTINNGTVSPDDQMQISDGRVVLLTYPGMPAQSIMVFDVQTGDAATLDVNGRRVPRRYSPRLQISSRMNTSPQVNIHMVGPSMYLFSPRSLVGYHLDKPEQQSGPMSPITDNNGLLDFQLSKDYAVSIQQIEGSPVDNDHVKEIQFFAFSREKTTGGLESFVVKQNPKIRDPNDIRVGQWQLVNGGFYYVTNANELKFLKSAPNSKTE